MLSLARKYRPSTFEQVIGQEHVIKILTNQLANKDTKQGYLFVGSAGCGKTSIARLFANAINNGKGNPVEIDAASNNGVENVRNLRETAMFKPIDSQYKVYILDEAHMMSTGAFNALLKILEEPPAHVVFILCTTDPQKIPATIISRVQRFNFSRMTNVQVENQLKYIALEENINLTDQAATYLASLAKGGMRDAISLLDTVAGYTTDISVDNVLHVVGHTDFKVYMDLSNAILRGNRKAIFETIEKCHNTGQDMRVFVKSFIEFVIDMQKVELNQSEYTSFIDEELTMANHFIGAKEGLDLSVWFSKLITLHNLIRYDADAKAIVEGALVSLCKS